MMILVITLSFSGCTDKTTSLSAYDEDIKMTVTDAGIVAENSSWRLEWDSLKRRVLLKNINDGSVWSTLPSELLEQRYDADGYEEDNHPQVENALILEYVDTEKMNIKILYGYTSCLQKGSYSAETISDGIRITYYFDKVQISVPVEYHLLDDGVRVSVDPQEITEGDFPIYRISISPFFCSVKNDTDNGYLFVPSGSGALINPSTVSSDVGYSFSYSVYGKDLLLVGGEGADYTNESPVRLPVFGAVSGDSGVCSIIDGGAEAATIDGTVGNSGMGYSAVYASFNIRGITAEGTYSDDVIAEKLSVSYYPLIDDKANYVGMAEKYREWLDENGVLNTSDDKRILSLEFYGATYTDAQLLGVPYKKLVKLTDVEQVSDILDEIARKTETYPIVNLIGFGSSGVDTGRIAGGYTISSKLSDRESFDSLMEMCNSQNIKVFMNYDIINFSKSGSGISTLTDRASSASGQPALRIKRAFSTKKENKVKEYFVKRNNTVMLGKKAIDNTTEKMLSGVSLSIASSVYSDYSAQKYYNCVGFESDYKEISNYASDKNCDILAAYANGYAAGCSDYLVATPLISDQNDVFSYDIPFYQIVFKGTKSVSSASINLAMDEKKAFLNAAETGIGLQFSVIKNYSSQLLTSEQSNFHSMLYDNVNESITELVNDYREYFELVKDAKVVQHEIIGDIRKTTFDNEVVAYVNYGSNSYDTEIGSVNPLSFIYK